MKKRSCLHQTFMAYGLNNCHSRNSGPTFDTISIKTGTDFLWFSSLQGAGCSKLILQSISIYFKTSENKTFTELDKTDLWKNISMFTKKLLVTLLWRFWRWPRITPILTFEQPAPDLWQFAPFYVCLVRLRRKSAVVCFADKVRCPVFTLYIREASIFLP